MSADVLTIDGYTGLQRAGLDSYDVVTLNLCAAHGLPGTAEIDPFQYDDKLDDWARRVRDETERHIYRFDAESTQPPTEYSHGNSLARFCCWYLLQVLQEDCGVAYNPDRKFDPDFCEPADLFVHGIVDDDGAGGTCASMPVVYVSVGRRLGYPLKLVGTRGHLFFRWDDPIGTTVHWQNPDQRFWIPPDRFNVEGSGEGIAYYPDSHYIQWPELWQEIDFDHGRYLVSMTATEELAGFLVQRSECFYELRNFDECLKAIYYARQLCPEDKRYAWLHVKRTKEIQEREQHFIDMEQMRRERDLSLPVTPGHVAQCQCGNCRSIREQAKATFDADMPGHSKHCQCGQCRRLRKWDQSLPVPPHGDSCQCLHCRQAREAIEQQSGIPGHPPRCVCPGCTRRPKPTSPFPSTHRLPRLVGVPNVNGNALPGFKRPGLTDH